MEKHPVVEYLLNQVTEQVDKLKKLKEKQEKISREVSELEQSIIVLKSTLEKAISEFKIENANLSNRISKQDERITFSETITVHKGTIADEAYNILTIYPQGLHIRKLTNMLVKDNKVEIKARSPIASVTSALLRDNRFISLGKGSGNWAVRKSSSDESDGLANNEENAEDEDNESEKKISAAVAQLG